MHRTTYERLARRVRELEAEGLDAIEARVAGLANVTARRVGELEQQAGRVSG